MASPIWASWSVIITFGATMCMHLSHLLNSQANISLCSSAINAQPNKIDRRRWFTPVNGENDKFKWLVSYVMSKTITSQKLKYEEIALPLAQKILRSVPALSTSLAKRKIWIRLSLFLKIFDDRNKVLANVISPVSNKINNLLRAYFFTTFSVIYYIINTGNIWRTNSYINQISHNTSANLWSMCVVRIKVMDLIRTW